NGALSRIGVFTTGLAPRSVAVDPSGQYLYVANFSSGSISAFFIHSVTGMLSPVPGSPFPAGATLQQLAIAKVP
ncbi:MAG TPA: beta-propeller fold lactonase family protein, partial [Candidatus Limnocylindrales bacterium]|nr:beta-propeller fold lactonase family protein [Candidatus Limnocylindrales bacterium]